MTPLRRLSGAGVAAGALGVLLVVAACSSGRTDTPSPLVGSLPPILQATPSPAASVAAPTVSLPPGSPARASVLVIDPELLAILPDEIEGARLFESPEAEAGTLTDLALGEAVERLAIGLVSDPSGDDWAIATVSALRPGTWTEAFDRDWRDSYDEAVCERAGGVVGHAEAEIGGRLTRIGTCANGVHTYHVRLAEEDILVSVSSIGERRFGELLLEGLEPPA